mgnify:CR=1 FL=1
MDNHRVSGVAKVMAGLRAAQKAGLAIKINAVALAGVNEDEFPSMVRWAHGRGMDMTFIEVMPLGDIEAAQERALLARSLPALPGKGVRGLQADVLLVPHHGSKTSSTPEFIAAVAPRWAWVQAGYRNRFGHPAPTVLERYRERDITVLQSPACGALSWQSARPAEWTCQRDLGLRYWQHRLPAAP